ncbi:helix-turn-helix domain-containing protein [Tenacibaculum mesophilum]|uniref:helix-turn-helix domain-containing protein n=1 Tax=Tenacibaculum mesophilum TaxID=104268 RepID=UPI00249399BA|nr:helix-turn-helix domain-containing protein [Tenacibaculum mesophilum]
MANISLLLKEVRNLKREIKNSSLFRKRIYTIKEASKVIGVSQSYIQKLISSKQIPHSKPTGKLIFIKRRDLEKFLMKNYITSKNDIDTIVANKLLELKTKSL